MTETSENDHSHDHEHDKSELTTTWTEGIHDLMLATLTMAANRGTFESLGITVTVGGQTITGLLVGRAAYFDALLAMTSDEGMSSILEELKSEFGGQPVDEQPHFLHLKDAHLVSGGSVGEGFGGAWRCKIGDVNAWSFGILSHG